MLAAVAMARNGSAEGYAVVWWLRALAALMEWFWADACRRRSLASVHGRSWLAGGLPLLAGVRGLGR